MNNNEIISLKNFGMLRSCDVAELLVTTDTSSEATESDLQLVQVRLLYTHPLRGNRGRYQVGVALPRGPSLLQMSLIGSEIYLKFRKKFSLYFIWKLEILKSEIPDIFGYSCKSVSRE